MDDGTKRAPSSPYRVPAPRPGPPRPALIVLTLVALGCIALAIFTSHKLYRMAQLRGEIAGAEARVVTFRGLKQSFNRESGRFRIDDAVTGEEREIQLRMTQAERYGVGEQLSVRCLPGSSECFVPDSIFISDGNWNFDLGLLTIELVGFAAAVRSIVKRVRTWRAAVRASIR